MIDMMWNYLLIGVVFVIIEAVRVGIFNPKWYIDHTEDEIATTILLATIFWFTIPCFWLAKLIKHLVK